ncbi:MAG TPA: glycosyltransferase family 2 protein [Spirochaetota bacterium]|nr:glycosyltransferase family 2 protein [Spirochaetota bacterium]HOS32348.1 glycosyltransferase family 2 protein [Spirochaetota bacterium]HOS54445.1 glycosyltransferase family 2 protein [Spirochaetota bacterium]HPK62976.1 glycosyltransferase family 2 protein [Spirochaetota bacterium]HQF76938.1 glycosyltransferase family 2 protein [Spirochaetota bacterium]
MPEISIVAPIFNEKDNVAELHREIKETCEANRYTYEIIFVDDGSTDGTYQIAKNLSPIKYIRLRRNFGQTAAMDAGIKEAKYKYIVTIDGDRQNDPNDIPNLIKHLESNDLDVVSGWRRRRKDTIIKKFTSRGANFLRKIIINDGIHDSGCSLKIYKKECFESISLYGEMHRFIPAILEIKGFRVGEIEVNHRPRTAGKTKYNWKRTVKGFIDMISVWFWNKYAVRPLHLLGGIGIFFILLGALSGCATVVQFFQGVSMSDSAWPILTAFLGLTGIQLFTSGLIADMMSKSYYETTNDSSYSVKEIVEN